LFVSVARVGSLAFGQHFWAKGLKSH
jgi:hypothetical protein